MQRMHRGLLSPGFWTCVLGACACGPIGSQGKSVPPNGMQMAGTAGMAGSAGSSAGAGGSGQEVTGQPLAGTPTVNWDLTGIIGTGQSLSVGAMAANLTPKATMPAGNNLKLSLGTVSVPPFDDTAAGLSLVSLVEPIRPLITIYPSAYPLNMWGESPHTALALTLTELAKSMGGLSDLVTVHTVVGESGQGMSVIDKTPTPPAVTGNQSAGRAYAATLFEAKAITRLAKAQNKTYGVGAIFLTHGEADAGNADYENEMLQLQQDYEADLKAITGQTQSIPLFTSQEHGIYQYAQGRPPQNIDTATLLQWKAGLDHPDQIITTGPKYQYPYFTDWLHLQPLGYDLMGEKYAEAFYEQVLLGHHWQPLQPLADTVTRNGAVITLDFHVPVPPLAWDDVLPKPHQSDLKEWAQGRGFEVRMGTTRLTIASVELLDEDTVKITCTSDVPAGATLGYAATSDGAAIMGVSPRWGQLKDSDPFVGSITGMTQANYAVAFELPVN